MIKETSKYVVDVDQILTRAVVPEHSVLFMEAMSGGTHLVCGPYLFFHAEDWLVAVGYPLEGEYDPGQFEQCLNDALRQTRARECWAACPVMPERLQSHVRERDAYYLLPTASVIPSRLQRLAQRAADTLRVELNSDFTSAHRRLWAEFTSRTALPSNVRELFARTASVLQTPGLSLLNAWDARGNLAACMLLDTAPHRFVSYLLGAHSRIHYTPYASDLLFREMLRLGRDQGKETLHLGLGVNSGIQRFKRKWGARPELPYVVAQWTVNEGLTANVHDLMRAVAAMPAKPMTKAEIWASLPKQRRFTMLWELEKQGRRSWIAGAAHFFCFSFENSLRKLFDKVDTVIFEGPLDQDSLDQVASAGHSLKPGRPLLINAMSEAEVSALERVVCGPRGFWARLLDLEMRDPPEVRSYLSSSRPWMAFFSLWTHYLRRKEWNQSVDLEAWHLAQDMGKQVWGMETIDEQIQTLDSIPLDRIVAFFRLCGRWDRYIRHNMRAYLKGDLDAMMGTSVEFPSRTQTVINRRDAVFLERMQPFLERGRCAVFVGSGHMLHLRQMLRDAGFTVRGPQ